MATNYSSPSKLMNDYANLRTIPALLGIIFTVATIYQFGGIAEVYTPWFDYTLTAKHATGVSIASYALAFASSETKQLENYETWEKAFIAAGPAIILGFQYWTAFSDAIVNAGTFGEAGAALVVIISWGVAVR